MAYEEAYLVLTPAQIEHMIDRFVAWDPPTYVDPNIGGGFGDTLSDAGTRPSWYRPSGSEPVDRREVEKMVHRMLQDLPAA